MSLLAFVAKHLLRLHYALSNHSRLGTIYRRATNLFEASLDITKFALWKVAGRRAVSTNKDIESFLRFQQHAIGQPKEPDQFSQIEGRLLARVAFHFKGSRLKYLIRTIDQIRELPFSEIVIFVDTNSTKTESNLRAAGCTAADFVSVHDSLPHPFLLTWTHRKAMLSSLREFDFFLYCEDDIFIPTQAILRWNRTRMDLLGTQFLAGFVRVELDRNNHFVASDYSLPVGKDCVTRIRDQNYIHTPFPYHAFWLYDQATMLKFVDSETYLSGVFDRDTMLKFANPNAHIETQVEFIRETAAFGFALQKDASGNVEWMDKRYQSKVLIPLTDDGRPDPRCFVQHLAATYGKRHIPHPARLGTIPIEHIMYVPMGTTAS